MHFKKKSKALSIFHKTKADLQNFVKRLNGEIERNDQSIESSKDAIKKEEERISERKEATVFLKDEIKATEGTIGQIDSIIGEPKQQ